jgi:chromosome segregation ATPase
MFNRKKRIIEEQTRTIAELNEKLQAQQLQLDGVNAQLEAYKQREYAISRAITDAAETASRIVTDAQKESDDIHDSAQKEYLDSQKKGEAVVQNAYENARDIIKKAETTSEEKIRETDAAVSAYVQLLNQFNESMKEQARQAEENVRKLSDYYARLNSALPELFAEVPQLNANLEKQEEAPLPDPEGDPAQLMRNIYTIQNRYLPREDMPDRTSVPEEDAEPVQEVSETPQAAEPAEEPVERAVPSFEPEEGEVVKVSDIVPEDTGTMDTEEFIAQTAALGDRPLGEAE